VLGHGVAVFARKPRQGRQQPFQQLPSSRPPGAQPGGNSCFITSGCACTPTAPRCSLCRLACPGWSIQCPAGWNGAPKVSAWCGLAAGRAAAHLEPGRTLDACIPVRPTFSGPRCGQKIFWGSLREPDTPPPLECLGIWVVLPGPWCSGF
jgi:hypothetical protein